VQYYGKNKSSKVITAWISLQYEEDELDETVTCRKFRQVRTEGTRQVDRELPFYNLDMIISLGYRVNSKTATAFRQWATARLREYIIKGFTMDDERLKNLVAVTTGKNYLTESATSAHQKR